MPPRPAAFGPCVWASISIMSRRCGMRAAASIPIALAEAASTGLLVKGSRVLLSAFGAGLTWGAGIIEWEGEA